VTGYGVCGHGWEMAERSDARLIVETGRLPLYDGALAAAEAGTRTGGDPRNREHLAGRVTSTTTSALEALCYDPQTSGGLLAAVSHTVVAELVAAGFHEIGRVEAGAPAVELR
jgi:selenide,water dikinase